MGLVKLAFYHTFASLFGSFFFCSFLQCWLVVFAALHRLIIVTDRALHCCYSCTHHYYICQPGKHLGFNRKAVWDVKWSKDNPLLFACTEKGRMYVFRDQKPEEPLDSSGYMCEFKDLCIKTARLDVILRSPESVERDACIKEFETKSLRDTRELLRSTPLAEAFQFVQDNSHPRLWRIVAEAALEELSFLVADRAFVRCRDYQAIQVSQPANQPVSQQPSRPARE